MLSAPDILQLATPEAAHETASFEESQVLGAQLADILAATCANGEKMPRSRLSLCCAHSCQPRRALEAGS